MTFYRDKFIDAIFIFVGIFAAFYFDQYQEDQRSKKELIFNLTEIMRDLPDEPPKRTHPPFKITMTRNEDGSCSINSINMATYSDGLGKKYLDLIKERGLTRFVKNRRLIRGLTSYYEQLVPKSQKAADEYLERISEKFADVKLSAISKKTRGCYTNEIIKQIETDISTPYRKSLMATGMSETFGYDMYKLLKDMGIDIPEKKTQYLEYRFDIEEPKEDAPK